MQITMIVVLYNMKITESATINSLYTNYLKSSISNKQNHEIILYDNGSVQQELPEQYKELNVQYYHDSRNLGIAEAYNYGFRTAKENKSQWLMLLDQDTILNDEFFNTVVTETANHVEEKIAAIVPQISSAGTMVSPIYSHYLFPLKHERPSVGIHAEKIMAINSGALINTRFLNVIGGFNKEFALDGLDHWLFYAIYKQGYKVKVMDVIINHDLSVMNYDNISIHRYKSILNSEVKYYCDYDKNLRHKFKLKLLIRLCKQIILVRNKDICFATFGALVGKR